MQIEFDAVTIFSGIAALGAITTIITIFYNRQKIIITVRKSNKDTFSINIINKTHQRIVIKEIGLHLSDNSDLSRESSYTIHPGGDLPTTWSINGIKEDIKNKHPRSKIKFAYCRNDTEKPYPYKGKLPKRIQKMIND